MLAKCGADILAENAAVKSEMGKCDAQIMIENVTERKDFLCFVYKRMVQFGLNFKRLQFSVSEQPHLYYIFGFIKKTFHSGFFNRDEKVKKKKLYRLVLRLYHLCGVLHLHYTYYM